MYKYNLKLLKKLTEALGGSSSEIDVVKIISEYSKELGYSVEVDTLGSVIAKRKVNKLYPTLMLVAHLDEVSFMVEKISETGLISAKTVGGISLSIMPSTRVSLVNRFGKIFKGTISSIPPHLPQGSPLNLSDLYFDFGFDNKINAMENVMIGDYIYFDSTFELLEDSKIISKALDDRLGCFALLTLMEMLNETALESNIVFCFSSLEEVGVRAAEALTNNVKPDLAIVVDISPADDLYPKEKLKKQGCLGQGVLVRVADNNMIAFHELINYQREIAKLNNIKIQDFISFGGTDAGAIHKALTGVPTLTLCLPARYIHSPSSIASLNDFDELMKLLVLITKDFSSDTLLKIRRNYD